MTEKEKLINLIQKENAAEQSAGRPYLRRGKATIKKIVNEISDQTAQVMLYSLENGKFDENYAKRLADDDKTGRIIAILWELYFLDGGNTDGRHWPIMEEALLDIFQQETPFYKAAQNRITNALPQLFKNGMVQTSVENEAAGKIGKRKTSEVKFILRDYDKHELRTTTKMLLDVLLIEFEKTHSERVTVPIRQYAQMRGIEPTKNALDSLTRQVKEDIETLADLRAEWQDKRNYLICELNGGTHGVHSGRIEWNWNRDFVPFLETLAPMEYSRETLTADPRTSTYYFSRYLDTNYRRNEGKDRLEKITIATLLDQTDYIPDIDQAKKQRLNVKERIIGRFFQSLDAIDRIYYDVYTEEGILVENPLEMDIEQFRRGYIMVDFSDYEKHPDRINNREKRKAKAASRHKKAT